jgi:hypothetical protein
MDQRRSVGDSPPRRRSGGSAHALAVTVADPTDSAVALPAPSRSASTVAPDSAEPSSAGPDLADPPADDAMPGSWRLAALAAVFVLGLAVALLFAAARPRGGAHRRH